MFLQAILQGFGLGFLLAIQPGPSMFTLIQTSSKKGFHPGLGVAFGIFLSDLICVVLAYVGIAQLFENPKNKIYIGLIGGTLLVIFGLFSIFHKTPEEKEKGIEIKAVHLYLFITKGFFLNILNPAVIFLWILWVGAVSSNKEYTHLHIISFFTTTLSIVFFTDILKAYFANKISKRLSHTILRKVSILLGIILLITGIVFIYQGGAALLLVFK